MDDLQRIEKEQIVEVMIDLWLQHDAPLWLVDYTRTELRKQHGLTEEISSAIFTLSMFSSDSFKTFLDPQYLQFLLHLKVISYNTSGF